LNEVVPFVHNLQSRKIQENPEKSRKIQKNPGKSRKSRKIQENPEKSKWAHIKLFPRYRDLKVDARFKHKGMSTFLLKFVEGDGPSCRGMIAPNGEQVVSAFDFMTKICKYQDSAARKEFGRLTKEDSVYKEEILAYCRYLKFPGTGQRDTPCMTIPGLQRLTMILGNKIAVEFRKIVSDTFTRVVAGDQSMIEVINTNAISKAPLQQIYRAALPQVKSNPNDFFTPLNRTQSIHQVLLFVCFLTEKFRLTP